MRVAILAGSFAALLLLSQNAFAVTANPSPRLCAMYSTADIVMIGAVGQRTDTADGVWSTWPVTTKRTYKGKVPGRFRAYTSNTSARATPDAGKLNILFVERGEGRLTIWGSEANTGGAGMQSLEAQVKALSGRKTGAAGSVKLWVASEQGAGRPHTVVRFRNLAGSQSRTIETDAQGRALIRLPAGRWRAQLVGPGLSGRTSLYGYNNPDDFTLVRGGCADLRIEPVN